MLTSNTTAYDEPKSLTKWEKMETYSPNRCSANNPWGLGVSHLERLSITFTANGKRETAGSCLS